MEIDDGDELDESGPRQPTMHDVATLAGVALSSVSRALGDHPDVSPRMRRRVFAAAAELGYEPNFLAQSLRTGTTRAIGFMARDIVNPFFAAIASGAEERLRRDGYAMMIMNSDGDPAVEAEHVRILRKRRVDGLILNVVSEDHRPTIESVSAMTSPVVLIDRQIPELDVSSVLSDHYGGSRAATDALLALGHREIALISGSLDVMPTRERARGLTDALRGHGIEQRPEHLVLGSFTSDYATGQTHQLLRLPTPPTALLCGGVQVTIGAMRALAQAGLTAGTDLAVVALDESDIFMALRPELAVVARDPRRMGVEAAALLLDAVAGQPPRNVLLPVVYRHAASVMPVSTVSTP